MGVIRRNTEAADVVRRRSAGRPASIARDGSAPRVDFALAIGSLDPATVDCMNASADAVATVRLTNRLV